MLCLSRSVFAGSFMNLGSRFNQLSTNVCHFFLTVDALATRPTNQMNARVAIVSIAHTMLAQAVTIAVRYVHFDMK